MSVEEYIQLLEDTRKQHGVVRNAGLSDIQKAGIRLLFPRKQVTTAELRKAMNEANDPTRLIRYVRDVWGADIETKKGHKTGFYRLRSYNIIPKEIVARDYLSSDEERLVLEKYNYMCCNCGDTEDDTPIDLDHKRPLQVGGSNHISNFQVLCTRCNQRKAGACRRCRERSKRYKRKGCKDCKWYRPRCPVKPKTDREWQERRHPKQGWLDPVFWDVPARD